jgi:hypothetical protein
MWPERGFDYEIELEKYDQEIWVHDQSTEKAFIEGAGRKI